MLKFRMSTIGYRVINKQESLESVFLFPSFRFARGVEYAASCARAKKRICWWWNKQAYGKVNGDDDDDDVMVKSN